MIKHLNRIDELNNRFLDKIILLYEKVHGLKAAEKFRLRYHWQFFENPANKPGHPFIWANLEDDAILGHISAKPYKLMFDGKETWGFWGQDLMVDPDMQGKGIGSLLYSAGKSYKPWYTQAPVAGALGSTNVTLRIIDKTTALFRMQDMPTHRLNLPLGPAISCLKVMLSLFRQVADPYGATKRYTQALDPRFSLIVIDNKEQFELYEYHFDEIWKKYKDNYRIITVRDGEHLKWRFINHPYKKYILFLFMNGPSPVAYAALHIKKENGKHFVNDGIISDILCDPFDANTIRIVLTTVQKYFSENFCTCIDIFVNSEQIHDSLKKLGFNLNNGKAIDMYITTNDARLDKEASRDVINWYLTFNDSDIETL